MSCSGHVINYNYLLFTCFYLHQVYPHHSVNLRSHGYEHPTHGVSHGYEHSTHGPNLHSHGYEQSTYGASHHSHEYEHSTHGVSLHSHGHEHSTHGVSLHSHGFEPSTHYSTLDRYLLTHDYTTTTPLRYHVCNCFNFMSYVTTSEGLKDKE